VNIPSCLGCVSWAVTHGNCKLPTTCRHSTRSTRHRLLLTPLLPGPPRPRSRLLRHPRTSRRGICATSVPRKIICSRRKGVRGRAGVRREPPFVCAAVGGPVSAAPAPPRGCRLERCTALGCPRLIAGLPGTFLSPMGAAKRSNGRCALPHPSPPGARGRHRLRPCHQKVGIGWGEQRAPPSARPGRAIPREQEDLGCTAPRGRRSPCVARPWSAAQRRACRWSVHALAGACRSAPARKPLATRGGVCGRGGNKRHGGRGAAHRLFALEAPLGPSRGLAIRATPVLQDVRPSAGILVAPRPKKSPSLPCSRNEGYHVRWNASQDREALQETSAHRGMSCRVESCGNVGCPGTAKTTARRPSFTTGSQS
jgi:hypothetical protein